MSPLGRVWRGRTRRRVRVPQAGYLPGGTPQRPGPAAGRQRGLGMARSRLRCFSLPFPPPLRVWFAFTGKFDASPRFFIGTGKKKKEEGETSPAKARGLHSLSLPVISQSSWISCCCYCLRWGKEMSRVVPRRLPTSPVPAKPELCEHQVATSSPSPVLLPPKAERRLGGRHLPPGSGALRAPGRRSTEGHHLRNRLSSRIAVFAPLPLVV